MRKANNIEKTAMILLGVFAAMVLLELALNLAQLFSVGHPAPDTEISAVSDKKYRIICLGDSWTNDSSVGKSENYPAQLEEILNAKNNLMKFKVYNLGFPNFNSTMVLSKFKNVYPALRPDAVVVMMGRSDQWNFSGIESKNLRFADKIKLAFLKSKTGGLAAILKYNVQYRLASAQKSRGIINHKDIPGKSLESFYELMAQGNMYRSLNMFNEAIGFYKRALDVCPDHMVALTELGRCYKLEQKHDLALVVLERVLRVDPGDKNVYRELDSLFIALKKPGETVDFYRRLFSLYPENGFIRERLVDAFIVLANTMFEKGRYDKTIENYLSALALDADNENIHNGLIYNLAILQKTKKNADIKTHAAADAFNKDSSLNKKIRDNYSRNLKEIIAICAVKNIRLIFSSYPREMPDLMEENAHIYNIPIVDLRPAFNVFLKDEDGARFFSKDGHCSREGYGVVAENIARKILQLLN